MRAITIWRAGAAALCLMASTALAQGFDDGSFGDSSFDDPGNGAASGAQPAASGGSSAVGGFGESSFEPGGNPVASVPAPTTAPVGSGDPIGSGGALPDLPQAGVVAGTGGAAEPAASPQPVAKPAPDPKPAPAPSGPRVDPQITAFELRDLGVPPQRALRQGQFHGPTPTSVPDGFTVTTENLVAAMNGGVPMVIIDVLGSGYGLPNAYVAPALAAGGSFNDRTQQQATAWLRQITGGQYDLPIVIYCSDPMCWLSYNASLRTIAAGYVEVYWYRGGLRAWEMAGLPLMPTPF